MNDFQEIKTTPLHVNLTLPDEVAVEFETEASRTGKTPNELISELLKGWAFEQYCKGESHANV